MFRPKIVKGAKKALIGGKQPQSTPSGMPTSAASPKPSTTPLQAWPACCASARGRTRGWGSRRTSRPGWAAIAGPSSRSSAIARGHDHHHDAARRARETAGSQQDGLPDRNLACAGTNEPWRTDRRHGAVPMVVSAPGPPLCRCRRVARSCPRTSGRSSARLLSLGSVMVGRPYCFSAVIDLDFHAAVLRLVERVVRVGRPVPAHAVDDEAVRVESCTSAPAPP